MANRVSHLWIVLALAAGIGVGVIASPLMLKSQLSDQQKDDLVTALNQVALQLPEDIEVLESARKKACDSIPQNRDDAELLIMENDIQIPEALQGAVGEALNDWATTKGIMEENCVLAGELLAQEGMTREKFIETFMGKMTEHLNGGI